VDFLTFEEMLEGLLSIDEPSYAPKAYHMARLIASSTKFQKAPPLGQAIHCVMSLVVNLREQVLDHGTASCEKALEHYNDGKDNPLAEKC
jgi:hypothetical protein